MTYEHPLQRPVVPPRLPRDPYPELMYDPSIPVVPVGELSKLTVKVLEQVQEHPFVLKGDAEKIKESELPQLWAWLGKENDREFL